MKLVLFFLCSLTFAQDAKFWTASTALQASSIYDIETSFGAFNRGAYEANPIMRPFVANRTSAYAVVSGINVGVMFASHRLRHSTSPTARKLWWVIPVVATSAHIFAGVHNSKVGR